jgi:hypothetical protein
MRPRNSEVDAGARDVGMVRRGVYDDDSDDLGASPAAAGVPPPLTGPGTEDLSDEDSDEEQGSGRAEAGGGGGDDDDDMDLVPDEEREYARLQSLLHQQ